MICFQIYTKWKMVCEKNCGSPHQVRAQKRHTYFVRVSAIFANHFCLGIILFLSVIKKFGKILFNLASFL
jgi:hypothetical protein